MSNMKRFKMQQLQKAASMNLAALTTHACTGFGVIVGKCDNGENLVLACWDTESDQDGRNSIFEYSETTGLVRKEVANFSEVKGPARPRSYNVMIPVSHARNIFHIGGNGAHTTLIADGYAEDRDIDWSIRGLKKPCVVASCGWQEQHPNTPILKIDVVRRTQLGIEYHPHEVSAKPGLGRCFVTHLTNEHGERVLFEGEPFLVPLDGDANMIADTLWETLSAATKVSLAVKVVSKAESPDTAIRNWRERT